MPRNIEVEVPKITGDESAVAGRGAGQLGWYEFASQFVVGKSVLDVGAGTGLGADILKRNASGVARQDIDPQLEENNIIVKPLAEFESNSYDVITTIDVVEHIEDDQNFLLEVCRIAKETAIITTPLWNHRRHFWPYHIREYTFREFHSLVTPFGPCRFFGGTGAGNLINEIQDIEHAFFMERMVNKDRKSVV